MNYMQKKFQVKSISYFTERFYKRNGLNNIIKGISIGSKLKTLRKITSSTTNMCWRCKGHMGSIIHIWWHCLIIKASGIWYLSLWGEKNRKTEIQKDLSVALFSIRPKGISVNEIYLMGKLFTTPRMLIAQVWKQQKAWNIKKWLRNVCCIVLMGNVYVYSKFWEGDRYT